VDIDELFMDYPAASDFENFRMKLVNGPGFYSAILCAISGTMCSTNSAAAPEFYLHHGQIDKLWSMWQAMSPDNLMAYSGDSTAILPGSNFMIADFLDLKKQGGTEAVCYINPIGKWEFVDNLLLNLTSEELDLIAICPVTPTADRYFQISNITGDLLNQIRAWEADRNNATEYNIMTPDQLMAGDPDLLSAKLCYKVDYGKLANTTNLVITGCAQSYSDDQLPVDLGYSMPSNGLY